MNDGARKVMEAHPRTEAGTSSRAAKGGQRTDINHQVNRIKEAVRLPKDFRPLHRLRHTYASMLASSGQVDLYTLQRLLTHKDPRMTQRYAHLRDETLRRASNLAEGIIAEAMKPKKKKSGKVVRIEEKKR